MPELNYSLVHEKIGENLDFNLTGTFSIQDLYRLALLKPESFKVFDLFTAEEIQTYYDDIGQNQQPNALQLLFQDSYLAQIPSVFTEKVKQMRKLMFGQQGSIKEAKVALIQMKEKLAFAVSIYQTFEMVMWAYTQLKNISGKGKKNDKK